MTLADLIFSPQGTTELDLKSFDCGRESVNKFFREEAQDYHAELFQIKEFDSNSYVVAHSSDWQYDLRTL